ncbi:MAG: phosphatidate cytidylyltransferase [Acidimicrobiales bacterium]|jgi:CDP-diglyceride synthetase
MGRPEGPFLGRIINVEYGPDREDEELDEDGSPARPDPSGPSTGGVRIIGAETAAEITSEMPVVPPAHIAKEGTPHSSVRIIDDPDASESPEAPSDAAHAELPHWTEPATGQVPAVLARDADSGAGAGILPPTWREEDADWTAHEEEFEPSMFSDDRTSLGALDETDGADEERRPWEFDLDSVRPGQPGPGASTTSDPITEPVDVVRAGGEHGGEREPEPSAPSSPDRVYTGDATAAIFVGDAGGAAPGGPRAAGAEGGESPDERGDALDVDEPAGPSGTPRIGRARRSGLLPTRLKAKRPDDPDGTLAEPLAAEPPGAVVAEVPGAGRRRSGLAGLAAADRMAEQEHESESAAAEQDSPVLATDEYRGRRSKRKPGAATADRPLRSSSNYTPEVTGGMPPAPVSPERTREREQSGGSTGLRVGTGVAVAVVALLAFKIGTVTSLVLSLLIVTFAAGEAFAVLRRAGWRPATLLGLVGTISLMVGAYNKGIAALPLVMVLITVFTLLWYLFGVERGSAVAGTASTMLVVGWVALLGSFAGLLLAPSTFPDRHGIAFLLGAIIATVANDVGALVIGRWVGSHQLAPNVSPNKTWEGLAGGALASILVSTVAVGAIHPWSPANAALLGVVVAVVAPLGDLCESLLKRDLHLKDMGTLLPGHGGVLDRVDALIFVLPATYYLVRALNIG